MERGVWHKRKLVQRGRCFYLIHGQAEGYTRQEVTFNGNVNVKQTGHAILRIARYDESYLVPLPDVKVKGILNASPYPELSGTYSITSSSGFTSEIDFTGKKFLSGGTKNSLEAKLFPTNERDRVLYTAKGTWTSSFTIRDETAAKDMETYDVTAATPQPPGLPSLDQQDPWESARLWHDVADRAAAQRHGRCCEREEQD